MWGFGLIKLALPDRPVRLNRPLLVSGLLIGLFLAWPLLLLGRPSYLGDSAAYYKGGRAAVGFVTEKFAPSADHRAVPRSPGSPAQSDGVTAAAQARGVRSISYSVLVYLLGAPQAKLVLLAIAQALLTGLVSAIVLDFFTPASRQRQFVTAAVLAFATPVAFVACLALPDIFTGLMVVAIVLLAIGHERLSLATKLLLATVGIFSVSAHSSHPPLAAGLMLIITLWLLSGRLRGEGSALRAWSWAAAPLLLGVALTVTANRVGFGEASIAAKRFPLTLARSVADGPGRWYLEKHCAIEHYAICEVYPNGFPNSVTTFLWGEAGIETRATPEQLDRIRAEEIPIVAAATREYLGTEMLHLSTSFFRQLVNIRPDATFAQRIALDHGGVPKLVNAPGMTPWLGFVVEVTSLFASGLGLLWMGKRFGSFSSSQRAAILLTIAALMINAAICVYFSGVANRYEARVIWLVPLLALALGMGRTGGEGASTATKTEPGCD